MQYEDTLYPLQNKVLAVLDGLGTSLYLTGGTAVSRFYYNHRYSDDLDFFCHSEPDFHGIIEKIFRALESFGVEQRIRAENFSSLYIGGLLKVDMVNDVASHIGDFLKHGLFSRVDNLENILANKLSALLGRSNPKDVADIWVIAVNSPVNWKKIFQYAGTKAGGIYPPIIAERLETFPVEWLDDIKWIPGKKPAADRFKEDIRRITGELLHI